MTLPATIRWWSSGGTPARMRARTSRVFGYVHGGGEGVVDDPHVDVLAQVVAGALLERAQAGEALDPVEPEAEVGDPGGLVFRHHQLEAREEVEDPAEDEVAGEHGQRLVEQLDEGARHLAP